MIYIYISLPKKIIRLPDDAYCSLEIISEKVPQQLNLDLLISCLVEQEKIPTQT